jgi:histidinol-phosphate phosphatase family protein
MKVILLDREGTLIQDPNFDRVDAISKVKLFPETLPALKVLAENGFYAVIITNQTNIAQGRITEKEFWEINNHVTKLIKPSGIKILKTYVCPHGREENCNCRKPKPTLLQEAAKDFDFDLKASFMIGDRESDIEAGKNAGCKTILVATGKHPTGNLNADFREKNLYEASHTVVRESLVN